MMHADSHRPRRGRTHALAAAALSMLLAAAHAAPPDGASRPASVADLAPGFSSPPAEARPRVWWHWLNGNVSPAGIAEDLDWMRRSGIGGVTQFDATLGAPPDGGSTLAFMSPEWRDALRLAVRRADELGLEFAIAGSPGWSETGGPWVSPAQAMKKLAWSETVVEGGRRFAGRLAAAPTTTGPFQDIPAAGPGTLADPVFYRDALVVAYRQPAAEHAAPALRVTASSPVETAWLTDGRLDRQVELPFAPGAESWLQYDFGHPVSMRSFVLAAARGGGIGNFGNSGPQGRLEASDDGISWHQLAQLPTDGAPRQTIAFPAATARWFRAVFSPRVPRPGFERVPQPTAHGIAEARFEPGARVHRFEDKAGWSAATDVERQPTPAVDAAAVVQDADVVDLSGRLRPDGTLDWTPPPGRWTVLRLGYTLTGQHNHPAAPGATGLEVDKLDARHVRAYADHYLGLYQDALGADAIGSRGLQALLLDSYEAGPQNWSEDLPAQFKARRGYDLARWAPVLAGRVVRSAEDSERFLWDFRRTLGELMAENHYGTMADAVHARGMRLYAESHENGRAMLADGMDAKKWADIPMGATWARQPASAGPANYDADVRESASVAHVYGQNLAAAESFTVLGTPYGFSPKDLKPTADRMMANGLNRFVIHASVHQPDERPGPGIGLGPFGQWFTRKETWAGFAGAWMDYLARSSHLLQQGRFVADIAWFYGEDGNITQRYGQALPAVPPGHAYDFVNADVVLDLLSVSDGQLATPSGMRYRLLALDPSITRMTLPVLRKLHRLAAQGAVIAGPRPLASPSLADDAGELERLADELWSPGASPRVYADVPAAIAALGLEPDLALTLSGSGAGAAAPTALPFVHRQLADGDIYFISNPSARPLALAASLRGQGSRGNAAQLWRADSGQITPLAHRTSGGRTEVALDLQAHDAVFVVLGAAGSLGMASQPAPAQRQATSTVAGPWSLAFQGAGAPEPVQLAALRSWSELADDGARHFSGTATYATTFEAPDGLPPDARILLDLGRVEVIAQVRVNGQPAGTAWKPPFEADITHLLRPGSNRLEIDVANLWVNRLIGDQQAGAAGRTVYANPDPYTASSPLLPSGLLGPVRLVAETPAAPPPDK